MTVGKEMKSIFMKKTFLRVMHHFNKNIMISPIKDDTDTAPSVLASKLKAKYTHQQKLNIL